METLALADFEGCSELQIKQHIAEHYSGSGRYDCGGPEEQQALLSSLDNFEILIAYESVGNWGCDSSSWFLLRDKNTGDLFENHGSHCSCYGFEGQWDLEATSLEYISSDKFYLSAGGYDDEADKNAEAVKEYVRFAIAKAESA